MTSVTPCITSVASYRTHTTALAPRSLFIWALRSHGRKRRELPLLLTCPEYAHLRVFRLRRPREAAVHVRRLGLSPPLARKVAAFFRACDTVRFAPTPHEAAGLAGEAEGLILALESESCSPLRS